jgi:hypothetical protein
MAATARRRGHGEDSVYFDAANNNWAGAVSLGYSPDGKRRIRRKVTGRTKTEVKNKLKIIHSELDARIQSSARYTMALCIEDWLSQGLTNRSPSTVASYRWLAEHAVAQLGAIRLKDLTAKHVQAALAELSGSLSTRSWRGGLFMGQCCKHAGQRCRGAGGAGCVGDVPGADPGRERVRVPC